MAATNSTTNLGLPQWVEGDEILREDFNTAFEDIDAAMSSGPDGWTSAGETWTYASASTFTVSGDVTDKYLKGDKIKWTQTNVRYGHIASAVYSAPNTTITIVVNDDYSLSSAAITDNYYSRQTQPDGFPVWFNFSPVYTGFSADPSLGGGYIKYSINGKTCFYNVAPSGNGTSNASYFTISAPIMPASQGRFPAFCISGNYTLGLVAVNVSITIDIMSSYTLGSWSTSGNKRALFSVFYEI